MPRIRPILMCLFAMTSFALSANAGVITMSFLTCKSSQTGTELKLTIDPSLSMISYSISGGPKGETDSMAIYSTTLTRGGYLFTDEVHKLRGAILLGGLNGDVGAEVELEDQTGYQDSFTCSVERQSRTYKPHCPHGVCHSEAPTQQLPAPIFHGPRHN